MPFAVKAFMFVVAMHVVVCECDADSMTREEFLEAAKGSFVTEMASFGTTNGDDQEFGEYICKNWRAILDEYDTIASLRADEMHGLNFVTISLACEELPPVEYLEFLDTLLDALEQRKSRNELSIHTSLLLGGRGRKDSFLAVNWEDPRVQRILRRAVRFFSDIDPVAAAAFQAEANGELDEDYMGNRNEGDPLPETLPGIKLKRPWISLRKQVALLTGKKVSPDPEFADNQKTRPERRGGSLGDLEGTGHQDASRLSGVWSWWAFGAVGFSTALLIWKFRGRDRRQRSSRQL